MKKLLFSAILYCFYTTHSLAAKVSLEPLFDSSPEVEVKFEGLTLVQFWASWCRSCSEGFWDLKELKNKHQGLRYITVSLDEDKNTAQKYITKNPKFANLKKLSYLDSKNKLSGLYSVESVPTILLLQDGKVIERREGHYFQSSVRELEAKIKSLGRKR